MALPNRESLAQQRFFNQDGSPIFGTIAYDYLQRQIEKAEQKGYIDGVKFVLGDIEKRVELLTHAKFKEYKTIPQFPDYASKMNTYFKVLLEGFQTLAHYANSLRPIHRSSVQKSFWLKIEKILGLKKGELANKFIRDTDKEYGEVQKEKKLYICRNGQLRGQITPADFGIPEYNEPDPIDELKNEVIEEPEESDEEKESSEE